MQHKRTVSQPKPVRPFKRFMETKKCDTGIDQFKIFENFAKRDPFYSMHQKRRTILLNEEHPTVPKGQVPFGTTKYTYKLGLN